MFSGKFWASVVSPKSRLIGMNLSNWKSKDHAAFESTYAQWKFRIFFSNCDHLDRSKLYNLLIPIYGLILIYGHIILWKKPSSSLFAYYNDFMVADSIFSSAVVGALEPLLGAFSFQTCVRRWLWDGIWKCWAIIFVRLDISNGISRFISAKRYWKK